jgi:hypothetical protein
MIFNYYYNNLPEHGLCRNNLIYTSLISSDQKTFCQWYYNDTEYHKGQNQVIDPEKMEEKWEREVKFLTLLSNTNLDIIPTILDIDYKNKKIFLEIDGVDFWQRSLDKNNCSFDEILPDWQDQMLEMIKIYRKLKIYKYSMHPSSYFLVNKKLKSINYFFTYNHDENQISIKDVESHIYSTRQEELKKYTEKLGIVWDKPQSFDILQKLCWESFRTNYPKDFIEKVLCIK